MLVAYKNPILYKETTPVSMEDSSFSKIVEDMVLEMEKSQGAGIAAPQIGHSLQIFIIDKFISNYEKEGRLSHLVCINPRLEFPNEEITNTMNEGCLSFPGISVEITRPANVTLFAKDEEGKDFEIKAEGMLSRAIQHEYDHLIGKTMLDHVGPMTKEMLKRKLKKYAKQHPKR